jgi:hypothetical protein
MLKLNSQIFCVEYFENTCRLISFTLRVFKIITENIYSNECFKYENCPNNAGDIYVEIS